MARPRKVEYDLKEKLRKIREAGLEAVPEKEELQSEEGEDLSPLPLNDRIRRMLKLISDPAQNPYDMLYLVMYDIEDNRVRNHIAKYLLSKGCIRIQKSVYVARTHQRTFQEINQTLAEVQAAYDNADSIILVPVQSATISSMKIIGKEVQLQSLTDPPNTLFY
jgi:CRISPR-associated endonuclease Cas2